MRKTRRDPIVFLALCYRFVLPAALLLAAACISRLFYPTCTRYGFYLWSGIVCVFYAAYSFVGYLLGWRHIYCACQDTAHQEMTPDTVRRRNVKKGVAYGIPAMFLILGLVLITASVYI